MPRIFVTSDFLMTSEKEQFSNRRWLRDILARPIKRATDNDLQSFFSSVSLAGAFSRDQFFRMSGIEADLKKTQFWFDLMEISDESIEYLGKFLDRDDLLVGYELSEQTRFVLRRLGVHYIDIWLHPVRFMDDILFAFKSSHQDINARLMKFDVPEDLMYLYADRIKIQTYKGWRRVEAKVKAKSALFVGQMMNDKSVCLDGHMLSVLDFKDRFEAVAAQHECVYYSRHPYLKKGDEEILEYLDSIPNVQMASEPSYRMLASERIKLVFGVSSSVIQEAKYFGKKHEFLFQPVLTYGRPEAHENSATVLQDFVSPHFWSDVLKPVMHTKPCPEISFLDGKDKVRDMLGFYWSYPDIDKIENLRNTVKGLMKSLPRPASKVPSSNVRSLNPPKQTPTTGFALTKRDIDNLFGKIRRHDVVSFDIFDTLVERVIDKPNDLHPLMQPKVNELLGDKLPDFPAARAAARDQAAEFAVEEEILLKDRYDALERENKLPEGSGEKLMQIEQEFERAVCRTRWIGKTALEMAKSAGKRIILISDIFFDREFVEELLETSGISGWDQIYLSSEEGLLKHSGRLFDHVLKSEGVDPRKILHIGDNAHSDIRQGEAAGIDTFHIPDKAELTARLSDVMKHYDRVSAPDVRSVLKGTIGHKLTSQALPVGPGHSGGSAELFGYSIVGPIMYGFAHWIMSQAAEKGLTDIYFLARDGEIAKRCFDIMGRNLDGPRTHYLLCSRRAVSVASIFEKTDIIRQLERNFTPCSLRLLLENRFGVDVDDLPVEVFEAHGYKSAEDRADWKVSEDRLRAFFSDERVASLIVQNARTERRLLTEHYRSSGLGDPIRRVGFVDIGHSGSLQAAICSLMNLNGTHGMYFATKEDLQQTIGASQTAAGYCVNHIAENDHSTPYQRYLLMFELLFQNKSGSFVRFNQVGDTVQGEFLDLAGEERRITFIETVHDSVCKFCCDFSQACEDLGVEPNISGQEIVTPYFGMLRSPWENDARLFEGIGFENRFSARDLRWIIPPALEKSTEGYWNEGTKVLRSEDDGFIPANRAINKAIFWAARRLTKNERKLTKLERDPRRFFEESKFAVLRPVARLL